jgi:hypothetical protein
MENDLAILFRYSKATCEILARPQPSLSVMDSSKHLARFSKAMAKFFVDGRVKVSFGIRVAPKQYKLSIQ